MIQIVSDMVSVLKDRQLMLLIPHLLNSSVAVMTDSFKIFLMAELITTIESNQGNIFNFLMLVVVFGS